MRRPQYTLVCFIVLGLLSIANAEERRPNIIVILCDDLGYGDLECFGHPHIKTPHLNRLAVEGMRLTNCYSAAPVCSPSRVGLLTGRSPNRAGVYDWIPPAGRRTRPDGREQVHMRESEVTIPQLLQEAGFSKVVVYWEDADEDGDGTGVYRPRKTVVNEAGWVAYLVAQI